MSAKMRPKKKRNQGGKETSSMERALKWIGAAMGAVLAFSNFVDLPLPFKVILIIVAVLMAIVSILVLRKREILIVVLTAIIGFILMTFLAMIFKPLLDRLTPKTSYAEKIYYMIVLDASENMNLPFEGYGSRWEAIQAAVDRFLNWANQDSNYGMVMIGGQNSNESLNYLCEGPTVPLIPLVSNNGDVLEDLSLINFQTVFQHQRPGGGGSLSEAFFLAKDELLKLPADLDATRIIILIASASDNCTGEIDWTSLKEKVELINKEIAVHEEFILEFILIDESPGEKVAEFAEQVNQIPVSENHSYTYIQVVNNYYLLISSIDNIINRLERYAISQTAESATVDINLSPTPCCSPLTREIVTPTEIRNTEVPTLPVTVTSTICSVITQELTTIVPLSGMFCTATPTLTPTITPSFTLAPITVVYPTATRDRSDNPRPPRPTERACCKTCGANSKPCGNGCIELADTCHITEPGCACDG